MSPLSDDDFKLLLKTRCIGITGGIATGKSTVAQILRDLGQTVIDADQLARDVTKPGTIVVQELVQQFGEEILARDGQLDRAKLRSIVMSNSNKRKTLESIIHPAIHRKLKKIIEDLQLADSRQTFFYEAALIFETGREQLFKEIWATTCPAAIQIERLCERSKISQEEALKIIANQMPNEEKARRAKLSLDTSCTLEELRLQVEECVKNLAL